MRTLILLFLGLSAVAGVATTPFAKHDKLELRGLTPARASVPRCGLFDLTLDLTATYDNPFDPDDVDVWGVFTSPQGKTRRVNGFLDQPFKRRLEQGGEKIEPAGEPFWKIRFTPETEGRWLYQVFAKDRSGQVSFPEKSFQATASTNAGFIHRSGRSPRMFAFDNGQPFFAVGENVCWGGKRGSFDYDDWLPALSQAGGNWMRIWMCSWNCALEWSREGRGDWRSGSYHGAGAYSLDNAWKLDTILDLADRQGIYVMLCLGTYGEFNDGGYFNEGQWKVNPYNVTNGGPCLKAADFWTNEQARKLYRQRLRYVAARYGWRAGIQSWEFWNEANPPAAWVAEMARFLKGTGEFSAQRADPFDHLVTTTYGKADIWKIPELDFTQSHHYDTGNVADHAPVLHQDAQAHAAFGKPHLMGEFGIDWRGPDTKYDPEAKGINLHNGLWASAMSGNAGGGMLWWWDSYVHPRNLYHHFTPLRKFADTVPWTAGEWKPLEIILPREQVTLQESEGVVIPARAGWGRPATTEFTITADDGAGAAKLPQYFYSPAKPQEHSKLVFKFTFDRPGRFTLKVSTVSVSAKLQFVLDGKLARELALSAVPPKDSAVKPEYEKTELDTQWKIYKALFNKEYGLDIPPGEHTLQLEVAEGDWMSVEQYSLTGFRAMNRLLPVNVYGMSCGQTAILWAQNAEHTWKTIFEKKPVAPVHAATVTVRGLPAGQYLAEWWDTWKGVPLRQERLTATAAGLSLGLPEIATDIAVRIHQR